MFKTKRKGKKMIYYLLLIGMICLFRLISLKFKTKNSLKWFYFATTILVILFQGFRSFTVGTDLKTYIPAYSQIGSDFSNINYFNFEIGYVILNKILNLFGTSERVFLIVVAAIIQVPIFLTLYKYSESPLLSVLIYFSFGNFIMTFSGLRQSIAMSICFLSYFLIKNKKFLKFLFLIVFASLFHKSALFFLVVYPAYYTKMKKEYLPFVIIGLILLYAFKNQIILFLSELYYGEVYKISNNDSYTMFLIYLILFFVSFFNKKPNEDYNGLRNILLILVCVYSLSSAHSYIVRIALPLSLFTTIFVPKIINSFSFDKNTKILVRYVSFIVCIVCFCYLCGGLETLPFKFFKLIGFTI